MRRVMVLCLCLGGTVALAAPRPPAAEERLRAALARAESGDAAAVPVLIDLLAELPAEPRRPAEEFLRRLAGEWAPLADYAGEDEIARKIRRDVWAAWWRATDGDVLLGALRRQTPTEASRDRARRLLVELGNAKYLRREDAAEELFALGRVALPQLREAARGADPEVARRAGDLAERIERERSYRLPSAALRLLGLRKPAGACEALLAYLPYAPDEAQASEVETALAAAAVRDGKPDPVLVRALDDGRPDVRAVAAEALVRGGPAGRDVARKALQDRTASVRLRVALALVRAHQRDGVPVLIDLLSGVPAELSGQAESALYQLAGEAAPETPSGDEPAQRKKCRDAWAAWWKANADRADLSRLTAHASLGYTVICDTGGNRVLEVDRQGKTRWSLTGVSNAVDAWALPGDRALIAEAGGNQVTERDRTNKILWRHATGSPPLSVQRLPNGNVFYAVNNQLVEVGPAGKGVSTAPGPPGGVYDAYRAANGELVCLLNSGECVRLSRAGKVLKTFQAKGNGPSGSLDLTPEGRLLVADPGRNKVTEYDADGKKLWEADAPEVTTATAIAGGHVLVASQNGHRVYEINRAGRIVWENKCGGMPFRARRR